MSHPNRGKTPRLGRNPTAAEIVAAREAAGHTQTEAGAVVYTNLRTWQAWEGETGADTSRRMHPALWELYLIKTNQLERLAGK
jgi:hypothetical protein